MQVMETADDEELTFSEIMRVNIILSDWEKFTRFNVEIAMYDLFDGLSL